MKNEIAFYKYHGTGNDFIMIDNMNGNLNSEMLNAEHVSNLCHRRFGIGADGLIILSSDKNYDFKMIYFNSDGRQSSMCGNGGRCIVAFAKELGYINDTCTFIAVDGPHEAIAQNQIKLKMKDVSTIEIINSDFFADTGSPHYVKFFSTEIPTDFINQAKEIRNSPQFKSNGVNVNFVSIDEKKLTMRTFERGVEDETYSCGTGVVASCIVYDHQYLKDQIEEEIIMQTKGGQLSVSYTRTKEGYKNIWLKGPAKKVYQGLISL